MRFQTLLTASTCIAFVSAAGAAQLNEQPAEGQAENATEVKTIYIDVGGIPRACTDQCASIVDFAGRCDGKLMNATQCQARASMFCTQDLLTPCFECRQGQQGDYQPATQSQINDVLQEICTTKASAASTVNMMAAGSLALAAALITVLV